MKINARVAWLAALGIIVIPALSACGGDATPTPIPTATTAASAAPTPTTVLA